MSRFRAFALLFCVLFLAAAACGPALAAKGAPQTPGEVLSALQGAIERSAGSEVESLADLSGILNEAFDALAAQAESQEDAALLPPMLAWLLSQPAGREAARPMIVNGSKNFIIDCVNSGLFAGKPASADGALRNMPLFSGASLGAKRISFSGAETRQNGAWIAPFAIHDEGNGEDYAVIGEFRTVDGACRLTRILNLDQLVRRIEREAAAR